MAHGCDTLFYAMKMKSVMFAAAAVSVGVAFAEPKGEVVFQCDFDGFALADNVGTNGLPKGWREQEWADKNVVYGYETGCGGKGAALKIDVRGLVGGQLQVFSGPWEQWQNSWYRLTFKAKGFDHTGRVNVMPRRYYYPWSALGWPGVGFRPENEWKEYSCVKLAKHDIQRDFGVMISTGDIGCFLIDDIKVEKFAENPEAPKPVVRNPLVKGNLVPQGSFEGDQTDFFIVEGCRNSSDIRGVWNERHLERAEGGACGRHCLKIAPLKYTDFDGKEKWAQAAVKSVPIKVAPGVKYRLSGWVKAGDCEGEAHVGIGISGGKGFKGAGADAVFAKGKTRNPKEQAKKPGEWVFVTCVTPVIPEGVGSVTVNFNAPAPVAAYLDGLDFRAVDENDREESVPAAPYEFALSFRTAKWSDPKIATWGDDLPLTVGVFASKDAKEGVKIPAMLRVTDYFGRVMEKKLTLVAGEEEDLDFDPKANGVLRVELVADDSAQAKTLEKVYARLPEPRRTGEESGFGTHMRICPGIIDYCAAIGIKWQRLHDCSNICKMKWANQKKGEYLWGDEQIDYLRAKGISILAMPDYPAEWIKTYSDGGVDASGLKREKRVEYDKAEYGKWCEELAKHYRGRISHYEIWNEPYIRYFFGGTPEEFGPIWLEGARGVRRGNPDAKVVGFCTELCSPQFMAPSVDAIPAKDKPDVHSVHYYYNQIPGDGDMTYERLFQNMRDVFKDKFADSGEIWNTEGNMALSNSFYTRRNIPREENDRAVAFGTRGWAETIAGGISKIFLYTTHNTDNVDVGGLMTLIDYDRSVNPEAAATATTAYFIDGLRPVKTEKCIAGAKICAFAGDGRLACLIWDDILVRGKPAFDTDAMPRGFFGGRKYRVYDAMGNEIDGVRELGSVPFFVTADNEDVAALTAALKGAFGAGEDM